MGRCGYVVQGLRFRKLVSLVSQCGAEVGIWVWLDTPKFHFVLLRGEESSLNSTVELSRTCCLRCGGGVGGGGGVKYQECRSSSEFRISFGTRCSSSKNYSRESPGC